MRMPTVAIIGRPNVGKSSLFNRFLKKRLAVVDKEPGVTRDRNYAVCDWRGVSFRLVDTGGIITESIELMDQLIYDQTEFALSEADLVLFLVDTHVGPDPSDRMIARRLQRSDSECILVANKADTPELENEIHEFLKLGLGDAVPISVTRGLGIGDLLDLVVPRLPSQDTLPAEEKGLVRVALVGRPNVGKSSFINCLAGEERLVVTPQAGTTRDAVDTLLAINGRHYILVDTAGLRRRYKVHENIEFYTNLRAGRAIEDCDVAVVLIDATSSVTSQDQRILEQVIEKRRPAVIAVNKWDLIEKDSNTADRFTVQIRDILASYAFLPVIYVSALSGQRVAKVMSLVDKVFAETNKRIPTSELNDFLQRVQKRKHPPARQGKHIKFNYVTQSEVAPPTFVFFVNHPKLIDRSYIGFLSNQIRAQYGFEGVPFRLKFCRK
ncbi:MAG: ribosome biogenesis GTPase Der [candidate division Zixibacteria bacterium]|nr:ribosome biogenesis GTPase Der [candidate division Zixibacteria bacterium]